MNEKAKNARLKSYGILGLTIVIVVIPFCLYYLLFVTSQSAYFSQRNFRVLATISDQISTKIDLLANNLVNLSEGVKQDKIDERKKQGEQKTDSQKKERKEGERALTDAERVGKAAKLVPDFVQTGVHYELARPTPAPRTGNNGTVPPKAGPNKDSGKPTPATTNAANAGAPGKELPASGTVSSSLVTMDIKPELGSFGLAFTYLSSSSELPGKLSFETDLKQLFQPFVARYVIDEQKETQERLFDEVVIAQQENGRVIFEEGPDGLTVVSLDNLLNSKGGKLELKLVDPASSFADVQIAGANYKLFLQPVRLSLSASNDDKKQGVRLVVCGLTRIDHFREKTWAVSYTVLIFFVFAVLLAVLSWPLLKLKLMGPKDRLRRVDFALTLFSALMGAALVTFILLDLHTYLSLNDALDQQLKNLSTTIASNFRLELGKALDQLKQLNVDITAEAQREPSEALRDLEGSKSKQSNASGSDRDGAGKRTSPGASPADKPAPSRSSRSDILTSYLDWKNAPYPFFNNATWTDESGEQRIKWTTRIEPTTFRLVADRKFFKDIQQDSMWMLEHDKKVEYSFELINSKTTGENVAIIATKVPNSTWVSNLDTRLISLVRTVLPPAYGYAIIDGAGNVIFHSDELKNLEEQFFAECENNRWLRAAVLARTERLMDANYLGKGYRMYVSPLANTPWTLVSFVDQRMARTINLEVITLSFILYLLFVLVILALILLGGVLWMIPVFSGHYLKTQGDGIQWLWPDSKLTRQYGFLIMSYVLIGIGFLIALREADATVLTLCCLAIPLVAGVLWRLVLRNETASKAAAACITTLSKSKRVPASVTGRLSYRTRYAIAFAGLLVIVSVLPAVGFFKIAHTFEMRLLVKHGQLSLARAIEERTRREAERYSLVRIRAKAWQTQDGQDQSSSKTFDRTRKFLRARVEWPSPDYALGVYDSCFFGTTRFDASDANRQANLVDDSAGLLECLLLEVRPLYNQSCIESHGLSNAESSDNQWRWKRNADGDMLLWKDKDGRSQDPSVALRSVVPAIVAPNTFGSWLRVILSILLIVLLPYGIVRLVARRFFLLDLCLPDRIDLPRTTGWIGSYVLLHPPMMADRMKDRYQWVDSKYIVADLRNEKIGAEWIDGIAAKPCELTIVLNNFEHRMTDPAANREKLVAIEHLLKLGRRVVVVSTDCPLSFSLEPKPADEVVTKNGEVKTVPPESPAIAGAGGTNGAADLKIEYHSSLPFSVEVGGKQSVATNGNAPAAIAEVPETDAPARWHEVFTNFVTVCVADNIPGELDKNQIEFAGFLKTTAPWRYIEPIRNWISQNGGEIGGDRANIEELISEVGEQAHAYHKAIWASCSEGQRCTLIQLAQDGLISPKNRHLRRLVKRGLIVLDPGVRLMDESFRRFVKMVSRDQDVEGWRQQDGGSAWQLLRAPLLLILVGVALFLFITQKDFYDSTISFMSAATAGIAALFRLLGMFHGKDKGAPVTQG